MKIRVIVFLLLFTLFIPGFLSADVSDLDSLQFSTTIKDLNHLNTEELDSLVEKRDWFLLDGSIAGMTLYSGADEEYLLDVLLMQGEWLGLEEVRKYDCHIIFKGDEWREIIPAKSPRRPKKGQILLNAKVLVLARVIAYEEIDGRVVPYLMVDKIRELP